MSWNGKRDRWSHHQAQILHFRRCQKALDAQCRITDNTPTQGQTMDKRSSKRPERVFVCIFSTFRWKGDTDGRHRGNWMPPAVSGAARFSAGQEAQVAGGNLPLSERDKRRHFAPPPSSGRLTSHFTGRRPGMSNRPFVAGEAQAISRVTHGVSRSLGRLTVTGGVGDARFDFAA